MPLPKLNTLVRDIHAVPFTKSKTRRLLVDFYDKAHTEGLHDGYARESTGCHEHCKQALEEYREKIEETIRRWEGDGQSFTKDILNDLLSLSTNQNEECNCKDLPWPHAHTGPNYPFKPKAKGRALAQKKQANRWYRK